MHYKLPSDTLNPYLPALQMHPVIKAAWVKRLRGTRYKQGRNLLRSQEGLWCPLGVLCDMHARYHDWQWDKIVGGWEYLGQETVLPHHVQQWAGLEDEDPLVMMDGGKLISLVELNDSRKLTFPAIADLIERRVHVDANARLEKYKLRDQRIKP